MADHEIYRLSDVASLATLPLLTPEDGGVLERLLWLAPEVALATATAVVRTNQPELHEILFGRGHGRRPEPPDIGKLARALVYLGLATAAPRQGRILPILDSSHLREAQEQVPLRVALWRQADAVGQAEVVEGELLPDPELRKIVGVLVERFSTRTLRDPRWLRGVAFGDAGALYAILAKACREQFGGIVDLADVNAHLQRLARTSEMLADALASEVPRRSFDPARQRALVERLRRFGWEEQVASTGRVLSDLAADAAAKGLRATSSFALSSEWATEGASQPTNGRRYFIRPAILPDSGGRALWAQEERLKPLQKMLAGDPAETGLRLTLATVEILLEYVVQSGRRDFLDGHWTRTANLFDGLQTRFGGFQDGSYGITIFPGARLDDSVGICPIVEVETSALS
jgi:hypothetical protein